MKTDNPMPALTDDETREAREAYNYDRAPLLVLFSSGRTGLFSRTRFTLLATFDTHLIDKETIDRALRVHEERLSIAAAAKFYGEPSATQLARDLRNADRDERPTIRPRNSVESLEL